MKILAGGVINQHQATLEAHLESLRRTADAADADVDFAFKVDPTAPDENADALPGLVREGAEKPAESRYEPHEDTTEWNEPTFHWLARERQSLLDLAADNHYDAVFLVDSDLILGPETLPSLMAAGKPITSAVFWTRWKPNQTPMPNVWLKHPYSFEARGWEGHEFLTALADRQLVDVTGLGACTLIRTDVLDRVRYHPLLEGLPQDGMWRGEDRSFSIRAERAHVGMFADAWPDIFHAYRPSDREHLQDALDWTGSISKPNAEIGDLISAIIEPLQEPKLQGHSEHVRGPLGALGLLPGFRETLLELPVGEEALVRVTFPPWYKINRYRGQSKAFRLTLVDAKSNVSPLGTRDLPWTRYTRSWNPQDFGTLTRTRLE